MKRNGAPFLWNGCAVLAEYAKANPYICGAVSINSCIIDPLGNIYKCWDDIGRQEYIAGNLDDGLSRAENTTKWLNYDFLEANCKECAFLPLCMGGCPNYKIRSGQNRCMPIKQNAIELVKLMYDLKIKNR
ncbi:MAG: SPASM domain-containing protein [Lachnospiraceae bacterium]